MDRSEQALACARRLAAVTGTPLRRRVAARELQKRSPGESAQLLHALVQRAHGEPVPMRVALDALVAALGEEARELAGALLEAARAAQLSDVEALVSPAVAKLELDPGAAAQADARQFTQTLGHLKWKARLTRNPDELARLATASDPSVVRNVLLNSRLTEDAVVRLAARRPVRPEVLWEVWRSPRWGTRRQIRRALAFNPYLPPSLGARVVPLLTRADWKELARDGGLHPEVRAQAERLLAQAPESGWREEMSPAEGAASSSGGDERNE
jgi:hypothetical protein